MTVVEELPQAIALDPGLYDAGSLPSWSRLPRLPASLPKTNIAEDTDVEAIATAFMKNFPALEARSFTTNALWRDTFALTGTMRTFYSAESIATAWHDVCNSRASKDFTLSPNSARTIRFGSESAWVQVRFEFKTTAVPAAACSGYLSLVPDTDGEWKIWVLRTILEQIEGQGDVDELQPEAFLTNGSTNGSTNDVDEHAVNGNGSNGHPDTPTHYDCLIVGAGQTGLSIGGRLKALGASYLVIDTMSRIGDSWLKRYDSTKLHTPREYAHFPFERTYNSDFQEYLSKYDLAKGHQQYARKFNINIQLETKLESGSWVGQEKRWCLKLVHHGKEQVVTASHVVLAIGPGGQVPLMPKYPHQETFKGLILHSQQYQSAREWKGKKAIVIGSANTAHDIADDMFEAGLSSVTMVQRSSTYILPVEYFLEASKDVYNATLPTEQADRMQFTDPLAVGRLIIRETLNNMAKKQPERFDALERAGFKTQRYGDIAHVINECLGGHYMDVGTSAKIANGLIKVKSDAQPVEYTDKGLKFSDGSEVEADLIVFATGFLGNVRRLVGSLLGSEVEEKIEDFWGLNPEGELYAAFKPSGHPGIWFSGGSIGHARFYSRFIAMQIKADVGGTPLPVYDRVFAPSQVEKSARM